MASDITLAATRTTLRDSVAPATGWRRLVRDWGVLVGATLVGQVLGAITSLALRVLLAPRLIGIWQAVRLAIDYGSFANLGVSKAAAREVAIAKGRGRPANVRCDVETAFSFTAVSTCLYATALIVAGGVAWSRSTERSAVWAVALCAAAVLCIVQRFITYHITIWRAEQRFGATARLGLMEALLTLVLCVLGAWCFGLAGLLGGAILVSLIVVGLVSSLREERTGWRWDGRRILRLIAIGLPIVAAGVVTTSFRTLDRVVILALLPESEWQLGCYSVALLVSGQLYGLANTLGTALGPRYGEAFGQNPDAKHVARLAARAAELQAAVLSLPCSLAIVLAPPLLAWFLPDYVPGLVAIVWLVVGVAAMSCALPGSQILVVTGRQNVALFAACMGLAVALVTVPLAAWMGAGLGGIAAAVAAAQVGYAVVVIRCSFWRHLAWSARWLHCGAIALALGLPLAIACGLAGASPSDVRGWEAIRSSLFVAASWAFSCSWLWYRGGWRGEWLK